VRKVSGRVQREPAALFIYFSLDISGYLHIFLASTKLWAPCYFAIAA